MKHLLYLKIIFLISHPKHVVGTQENRLNETMFLQKQSDLGMHCLSRPFLLAINVQNF